MSNELNDMDRFYDPCDDDRTQKQIAWEDGVVVQGSLKEKIRHSIGVLDIGGLGRIVRIFIAVGLISYPLRFIVESEFVCRVLVAVIAVLVFAADLKLFCDKQRFGIIQYIYLGLVCLFMALFNKQILGFVNAWGFAAFDAGSACMDMFNRAAVNGAVIVIKLLLITYMLTSQLDGNKYDKLGAICFIIAALTGSVGRFVPMVYGSHLFAAFSIGCGVLLALGFILWLRTRNYLVFGWTMVITVLSQIEIIHFSKPL